MHVTSVTRVMRDTRVTDDRFHYTVASICCRWCENSFVVRCMRPKEVAERQQQHFEEKCQWNVWITALVKRSSTSCPLKEIVGQRSSGQFFNQKESIRLSVLNNRKTDKNAIFWQKKKRSKSGGKISLKRDKAEQKLLFGHRGEKVFLKCLDHTQNDKNVFSTFTFLARSIARMAIAGPWA